MTFWEAFKNSTIIQGLITLIVMSAVVYLVVQNMPVPPMLEAFAGLIVGFYFGSKVQASVMQGPKQ